MPARRAPSGGTRTAAGKDEPASAILAHVTRHYLALDLGAESGRAMLAHIDRRKIEISELHRFKNTPVSLPTGLYWDTLYLFHEICESIRIAARSVDRLDGIGIDTWGVDFGLLDASGELLGNPRHYRDRRTLSAPEEVFAKVPRAEIFRQTGIQFMNINSLYQLYVLQRDSPRLLGLASKLLFMPDLFNYFLTGSFASERTIASTSQFYDPRKRSFRSEIRRACSDLPPNCSSCRICSITFSPAPLPPSAPLPAHPSFTTRASDPSPRICCVSSAFRPAFCRN